MTNPINDLPASQDTVATSLNRSRQRLMLAYVDERVDRFKIRFVLYTIGCIIAYYAVSLELAVLAFAILLAGEFQEYFTLDKVVRKRIFQGRLKHAQIIAAITGALQGLSLAVATSFYFFQVENPNILFVIGALGLGAVNSAIILPKNPTVAFIRLSLYAVSPPLFVIYKAISEQSLSAMAVTDVTGSMLLFCMLYMFFAFTKAGLTNARITADLDQNRAEMRVAVNKMQQSQAELRQLSMVARNANDRILITDAQRNILWMNDAYTQHLGRPLDQLQGQNINEALPATKYNHHQQGEIGRAVAAQTSFRGDIVNTSASGRETFLDLHLFPVFDDGGRLEFYISIERDVTEAKQHAREMAEARKAAEQGAKAKSEFLANMSHEIRTPLTGIIGMSDLLSETDQTREQERYTSSIRGSSLALMAIINDVLDLSKLDAGRMDINPVNFSPARCFEETVELLRPTIESKSLDLTLEVSPSVPPAIKSDDGRIRQVLTNILGNAGKFTSNGSVTVRLDSFEDNGQAFLEFEVEDTGIGIDPDKQARIFDHFTQAEASTTRSFGGTGLGLSISRHIVEVMGGKIGLVSAPGVGSTFKITLPVDPADPDSVLISGKPVKRSSTTLEPGLRILIAEDNQTTRFLLAKYLKDQPIDVDMAENGLEAVQMAGVGNYDLIFMDRSMPELDGIAATQHIRQLDIAQPHIVALTAHAFDSERQVCLDAGMDGFLTKPIRKQAMLEWLQDFQFQKRASAPEQTPTAQSA